MTDPLREALVAIERAEQAVGALCSGKLRWEMRVPAEPDHDPDLIISNALRLARAVLPPARADGLREALALAFAQADEKGNALRLRAQRTAISGEDWRYTNGYDAALKFFEQARALPAQPEKEQG